MPNEIGEIFVSVRGDISGLTQSLVEAGQAIEGASLGMQGGLAPLEAVGENVFGGIARAIGRAASGGSTSMRGMVDSILSDLRRLAVRNFITAPLQQIFSGLGASLFGGARAEGGPVSPGRAFLVGERGPELFVPSAAGRIVPRAGGAQVTVNIQAIDAQSVLRSEAQIGAMLARATNRGLRNL